MRAAFIESRDYGVRCLEFLLKSVVDMAALFSFEWEDMRKTVDWKFKYMNRKV